MTETIKKTIQKYKQEITTLKAGINDMDIRVEERYHFIYDLEKLLEGEQND